MYKILSWEKYQARTDRPNYPWVKLHRSILTSPHYFGIPEDRRWEWPLLLCMANHETGIIEGSDYDIAFKLRYEDGRSFDPKPFLDGMLQELPTVGNQLPTIGNHSPTVGVVIREDKIRIEYKPLSPKPRGKRARVSKKNLYPDDFLEFWEVGPMTGSKKRAATAWAKCGGEVKSLMYRAVIEQTKWREAWAKADPAKFIREWKDMERWIRDERFNDVLDWPADKKQVPQYMDERDRDIQRNQKPAPGAPDAEWARYLDMPVDEYRKAKEAKK